MHTLLLLAHESVCHADRVSQILSALHLPHDLPPSDTTRKRLAQARNLLAEHRDERVLYWRLTGEHTQHVIDTYERLGVEIPGGSIDTEHFDSTSSMRDYWGTIGALLSLPDLYQELKRLEARLEELVSTFRTVVPEAPGRGPSSQ